MHELSIALSILECAVEEAQRRGSRQVLAVHIRLGPLAGVIRDALLSAYEMAREEWEILRSSRLAIEDVPLTVHCSACDTLREPPSVQDIRCPVCGAPTPDIRSGRELEMAAMEILD